MKTAAGRVGVLDIESVPDADALSQAPRFSNGGHDRHALHRLVSATVLVCVENADGFAEIDLRTFAHPGQDETAILGCVDLLLPDPAEETSRLVTWNGRHDLRLLRQRACSNWMFGMEALPGWCSGKTAGVHVDVMDRFACGDPRGRWRLADVCAGLGFAIRAGVSARPVLTLHSQGRHDAVAEHNRLDVVGTFLAYAYHRSFETGAPGFVTTAWVAVSELLSGIAHVDPNVQSLAGHHLASLARRRIAAPVKARGGLRLAE